MKHMNNNNYIDRDHDHTTINIQEKRQRTLPPVPQIITTWTRVIIVNIVDDIK